MHRRASTSSAAMDEGHCGLPIDELTPLTQKLLDVPAELVETALGLELEQGTVIASGDLLEVRELDLQRDGAATSPGALAVLQTVSMMSRS
jgi:hypothetical protein